LYIIKNDSYNWVAACIVRGIIYEDQRTQRCIF